MLSSSCNAQGYIAPLPTGDPFECFARGVNGVLERLSAECSSDSNSTLDWASAAALQSVANLGLAVASLQPLGSSPWTYSFPFYSIQVSLLCCQHALGPCVCLKMNPDRLMLCAAHGMHAHCIFLSCTVLMKLLKL